MASYVLINGEILSRSQAKVDIEDRGYQFGDGIYEVVRFYNGKPFALKEHIDRFYASAEKAFMKIHLSKKDLEKQLLALLAKENIADCNLYFQYSRGVSPRNHVFSNEMDGTLTAYVLAGGERPIKLMENGGSAVLSEDTRWLHCDIKTISLMGNVLLKHKATKTGCLETILHRDGIVTEGTSTNVWMIKDGTVYTHPANHLILNGITRQRVLTICKKSHIDFSEQPFTTEEMFNADEVFITSTTLEVVPILKIDGKPIGDGKPGNITRKLQQLFEQEITNECGAISPAII